MFVQELGTAMWTVSYDFRTRIGTSTMPDGYCTDMSGAIAFFTRIDPAVLQIITRAGSHIDTTYDRLDATVDHTLDGWRATPRSRGN